MQKYPEKASNLALDFLRGFGRCILAMGERVRAQTAPFPDFLFFGIFASTQHRATSGVGWIPPSPGLLACPYPKQSPPSLFTLPDARARCHELI